LITRTVFTVFCDVGALAAMAMTKRYYHVAKNRNRLQISTGDRLKEAEILPGQVCFFGRCGLFMTLAAKAQERKRGKKNLHI